MLKYIHTKRRDKMTKNSFKKFGELYIKFNQYGVPVYAFVVNGKRILQCLNMSNRPLEDVMLPKIEEKGVDLYFNNEELGRISICDEKLTDNFSHFEVASALARYLKGCAVIDENCFKRGENIVVTTDYPIRIKIDSAQDEAYYKSINYLLPEDMTIYKVQKANSHSHKADKYYLIAHKNLEKIPAFSYMQNEFSFENCERDFKIAHDKNYEF